MKKVKLSSLKDAAKFMISKRSEIVYYVVKKVKGGILVSAVISNKTYTRKGGFLVWKLE